tara:strand:- start:905 stop:1843 length:939 start_codon:yes stop_codon:yes gene_type:complete
MSDQTYSSSTNLQDITSSVSDSVNNVSESVSSSINSFSQQSEAGIEASSEFLQSNTIIAKFAFIILIVIIFLFLLNLGILIMNYFFSPSKSSPYLVRGLADGSKGKTISQDPKQGDSIFIRRSNNEESGIEFTWTTWIRIDSLSNNTTEFQHIFHKGSNNYLDNGIADVNNAPGLYLTYNSINNQADFATLRVIMSTNTSNNKEYIEIDNIPLQKWVHVGIRLQNTTLDTYVNGTVASRLNLRDVPLQNYYDVHVCQNGGFTGKVSNLQYHDKALNIFQINKIVADGPDLTTTEKLPNNYNYLSTSWYTNKI